MYGNVSVNLTWRIIIKGSDNERLGVELLLPWRIFTPQLVLIV